MHWPFLSWELVVQFKYVRGWLYLSGAFWRLLASILPTLNSDPIPDFLLVFYLARVLPVYIWAFGQSHFHPQFSCSLVHPNIIIESLLIKALLVWCLVALPITF